MSQNFGVLRVVRVRPPASTAQDERGNTGWLPEERLVHLLKQSETSIGRALTNDIILMDPTVSREHARLIRDENGWCIYNVTPHNIVRVNGRPVPNGSRLPVQPQDFLVMGSTMLQLIAPRAEDPSEEDYDLSLQPTQELFPLFKSVTSTYQAIVKGNTVADPAPKLSSDKQQLMTPLPPAPRGTITPDQDWRTQRSTPPALRIPPTGPGIVPQPEPEMQPLQWEEEEESLLGAGVTMQFALPQRMSTRTRWLIAGIGIVIIAIFAIVTLVLNSIIGVSALMQNGSSSLLAALTIPLIPALVINLLVSFIDRFEREPWFLRLAAFLWGAIIAIPPAFFIEQNIHGLIATWPGLEANPLLRTLFQGSNAGITEETVKGLGLLLLFVVLRDEFDNVTDGIVYGALIGAGFAMVENFVYFAWNSKDYLLFLIVGRIVLGWLCHSTFTMCLGAALGYVRHTKVRWRQIVIPLLGYLIAVGLHTVFDFVMLYANALVGDAPDNSAIATFSLIAIISDYIPPFIAQLVLLYLLIKALAHEAAVIREFLAPEVADGIVRVDEYALLQNSFLRTREERRVLFTYGWKQWMRVRALYQTEIGLAFRKWHVSMGDKPKLGYRQPEDAYRERIRRLRREIAHAQSQLKVSRALS